MDVDILSHRDWRGDRHCPREAVVVAIVSADPYATLGVSRAAGRDEIKRAYRKRAKKAHPDRAGGSHEEMARLNKAVALLEDPKKRAAYDAGEDPDRPARSIEEEALAMVVSAMEAVYAANPETKDMADQLRRTLGGAIAAHQQEMAKAKRAATKAAAVARKLRGGEMFRELLERKADEAKRAQIQLERTLKILGAAADLAKLVSWDDPEAATITPRMVWR